MKEEKEKTLRERFDATGRGISLYARVYGLDPIILQQVLAENLTGERQRKGVSKVRMCILRLQEDGIWKGALPWKNQEAA